MNAESNISNFLANFKLFGNNIAVIYQGTDYSYNHILARINFWQDKLNYIQAGTIVGIEGDFSPESIAILFVLLEQNAIIVPLDINYKNKNESKYDIAQLEILIRINGEKNIDLITKDNKYDQNELYKLLISKNVPGLVLFTSGSSGEPKAALHNFSKLLTKFDVRRKALRTINFLLFDHWGGLNTLFHVLSNGGTVVTLENRNPVYVCSLIEKYKVELLPTSPTFLNMLLLSRAYEKYKLESLKVISYGAEPMPESLLNHLNKLFPNIKLQQTYGLIELGVMRSKSENNDSLWVKIGGEGFQTRVIDNILQVKSDSAMIGYLNAKSPFTDDGWFITGDTVEEKGEYFKILGRKSEIINVGGEKVFPQEVENVILLMDSVLDVMVYGEKHPFTGNIVCAKVYLDNDVEKVSYIKQIKLHCKEKLALYKVPIKIIIVDEPFSSDRFKKKRK